MRWTMGLSIAIGLGSVFVGLTARTTSTSPPGGAIVLTAAAVFVVAAGLETLRGRV